MRKAVTPVLATILLLIITVAIVGVGYSFISSYISTITSKAIGVVSAACHGEEATFYLKNFGTSPVQFPQALNQTSEYLPVPETGLLFHFNEGSGGIAADSSAQQNNGTLSGTATWIPGIFGNAINFTGNGSNLTIPEIPGAKHDIGSGGGTIEMWVKPTSAPSSGAFSIITKSNTTTGWIIRYDSANKFVFRVINGTKCISPVPSPPGNWYHVGAVWNNTAQNVSISINGVKVATCSSLSPLVDNDVDISMGGFFPGAIDEFRLSQKMIDFQLLQQGWGYGCTVSGSFADCGDVFVQKMDGAGYYFNPSFQQPSVEPGQVAVLKEGGCSGKCVYSIIAGAVTAPAQVMC